MALQETPDMVHCGAREPTVQQAIDVFVDMYTYILSPAFQHPIWLRDNGFPQSARTMTALLQICLGPDHNPALLKTWFASFVRDFCEKEMHILWDMDPGTGFDSCKYAFIPVATCEWYMSAWVRHVHVHRQDWSWGIPGSPMGEAGFIQAVAMWSHCFARMLQHSWARRERLYNIACWEMKEYLYKWAVAVPPWGAN